MEDISNFYVKFEGPGGHPDFMPDEVESDDPTGAIVQKWEMILFTQKGEVFGRPNMGADLESKLWKTKFPAEKIKSDLQEQIATYIPELQSGDYTLAVYIMAGTHRDIGVVELTVNGKAVTAAFV